MRNISNKLCLVAICVLTIEKSHAENSICHTREMNLEEIALAKSAKPYIKELPNSNETEECEYHTSDNSLHQESWVKYKAGKNKLIEDKYIYFLTQIDTDSNSINYSFSEGQVYSESGSIIISDKQVIRSYNGCSVNSCELSVTANGKSIALKNVGPEK